MSWLDRTKVSAWIDNAVAERAREKSTIERQRMNIKLPTQQTILSFDIDTNHNLDPTVHSHYQILIQDGFKPMGLLLKGSSPALTRIHSLMLGCHQMLIGSRPFRGHAFETPVSVDRLKQLASQNMLAWPGDERVIDSTTGLVGNRFTLRISGPVKDAMLWGYEV